MPASVAALAPGNAIIESECPAKASWRSTISQPTSPAITATMLPAINALDMKWYSRTSLMSRATFQPRVGLALSAGMEVELLAGRCICVAVVMVSRRIGLANDHEPAVGGPQ